MTISRRSLLLSLVPAVSALALAGCEDDSRLVRITTGDGARPSDAPEHGNTPAPTGHRGQVPANSPPVLTLPSEPAPQGGTFVAMTAGDAIVAATAEFNGREFRAVQEDGAFLAFLPVGQPIGSAEQVPPGTYPVVMRVEQAGNPRPLMVEGSVTVVPTDFPVEYLTFAPQVAALLEPSLAEQEIAILKTAYGGFGRQRLWEGSFVRPSAAEVSDVYGVRRSYQGGPVSGSHSGVDFGAGSGVPVVAAATGQVVLARMMPVRGNMVILDHGAGVFTGYCHLASFWVEPGQNVHAGESIAATGATGLVTGPHLHWEVVAGGMHVDGLRWLQL